MNKTAAVFLLAFLGILSGVTAQPVKSDSANKWKEPEMVPVEGGTYTMGY